MQKRILEVLSTSIESCIFAQANGADRIELCANFFEGGCTPSFGLIKNVISSIQIPILVMVRPRGGNFVYSPKEVAAMIDDIELIKELGCDGIVTGALNQDGMPDKRINKLLISHAGSVPVTFHRAFDFVADPLSALDQIIDLGFLRLLTAGGPSRAENHIDEINKIVDHVGNRMEIVVGSGINTNNIQKILLDCSAQVIHTAGLQGGCLPDPSIYHPLKDQWCTTDIAEVSAIRKAIDAFCQ